jgi:hypothetical protein
LKRSAYFFSVDGQSRITLGNLYPSIPSSITTIPFVLLRAVLLLQLQVKNKCSGGKGMKK